MKCQGQTTTGPCARAAMKDGVYCRKCARKHDLAKAYRVTDPELKECLEHQAEASLLDISHEIVLLLSLIERRLNMASDKSEAEKTTAYNFVANQLANVAKMKEQLVKLGKESRALMPRSDAEAMADSIIDIVSEELKLIPGYEEIVDRITNRIATEMENENE